MKKERFKFFQNIDKTKLIPLKLSPKFLSKQFLFMNENRD